MSSEENLPALTSLIAGGFAGITVDVALFPLDTLKTRLQSQRGLFDTGGFGSLYKGVVIAAVGSIPTASLFFFTYNTFKNLLGDKIDSVYHPIMHMTAASAGEVGASLLKVPFDVIKQRQQASKDKLSALAVCKKTIETDGYLGLYRGFGTTVFREVPFVLIQFPIWEWLKLKWGVLTQQQIGVLEVAICGAVSGGIAAGLTTPLDVAKTRITLADKLEALEGKCVRVHTLAMLKIIYKTKGIAGLFSGFIPRTVSFTVGGAVFFGAYQFAVTACSKCGS